MNEERALEGDVVVIGGGPAGLTAAYELVKGDRRPIVLERGHLVGGLARTENYKGFHFDMGGHRFFTKVARVNRMWREVLGDDLLARPRLSRIYYRRKLFAYPLEPWNALRGLGPIEAVLNVLSYVRWQLLPYRREETFEQWVTNRFGKRLFTTFFAAYTEKVWGIPCSELKAEWAAQRIKDLSLWAALRNMVVKPREQIRTLIDRFDYPRLGPGMMWSTVKERVEGAGGVVRLEHEVIRLRRVGNRIASVEVTAPGGPATIHAAEFLSSLPLVDLVSRLDPPPPPAVLAAAAGLRYRDFLTVCLVVDAPDLFPDNWIYVQDAAVRVGRIQNFKNWSRDMVPDAAKTSLGLEYFCNEGDALWSTPDADLVAMATAELAAIGLASRSDVTDGCVFRVPKAYPVYDSAYGAHLSTLRGFVDGLENLQTIGRSGLHRYNNQDHAMLTAMLAVENLLGGQRHDLWSVNTEARYHEEP